ncbi:hypothetical protein QPK31_04765 [Massilia sp. YIM B02769]|uniref:hypothetical protein n=1 Tax=Massilia sp. YIM B02769 TaxID=3050129 RepID=UPI0025B6C073|nr:hypothetical protein [Massilia sp. YIM B02769]MDN4057534.1 hypothetical protein [Massilia sp. YIM B02769]
MIRRTALLSFLTLSLLLSACSKKNDDTAGEDAQAQAASEAQEGNPPADEAPPPPPPKMDYWPAVGPLVAGNYGGACVRMPDGRKMDGSVALGADGKAAAGGIDIDFREARKTSLMRVANDKGEYATTAIFAMEPEKAGLLTLHSGETGKGSIIFSGDDVSLTCSDVSGVDKINAEPFHKSMAKFFNRKKQTVSCLDTKNLLVRRDLDVEIDDAVVKIGGDAFDMNSAAFESIAFDDNGANVTLGVGMPDKRTIAMTYDGAGTLTGLMATNAEGSTHSCNRKE